MQNIWYLTFQRSQDPQVENRCSRDFFNVFIGLKLSLQKSFLLFLKTWSGTFFLCPKVCHWCIIKPLIYICLFCTVLLCWKCLLNLWGFWWSLSKSFIGLWRLNRNNLTLFLYFHYFCVFLFSYQPGLQILYWRKKISFLIWEECSGFLAFGIMSATGLSCEEMHPSAPRFFGAFTVKGRCDGCTVPVFESGTYTHDFIYEFAHFELSLHQVWN